MNAGQPPNRQKLIYNVKFMLLKIISLILKINQIPFGGRALPGPAGGAKAFPCPLAAIRRPTSKGRGTEWRGREGDGMEGKGEKRRAERGKEGAGGGRGGKEGMNGREGKGRGGGAGAPPPHDLFSTRPCQYSGRREASFELSNATICPHGSKLWCPDLAIDNALRRLKKLGENRGRNGRILTPNERVLTVGVPVYGVKFHQN